MLYKKNSWILKFKTLNSVYERSWNKISSIYYIKNVMKWAVHPSYSWSITLPFNAQTRALSNLRDSCKIWLHFCTFCDFIIFFCSLPCPPSLKIEGSLSFLVHKTVTSPFKPLWSHWLSCCCCPVFNQSNQNQTWYPYGFVQGWIDFFFLIHLFKGLFWGPLWLYKDVRFVIS